jgi:threonine dehydrogenase-like Zn-dependent dehydrogenase
VSGGGGLTTTAGTALMRAAVLAGPELVRVEAAACPAPGRGEVRVRLEGSGVCGSDLAPWQGAPWFAYPFEAGRPGHEGWGVVEAVGAGVSRPRPGTRVATLAPAAYATHLLDRADRVVPLPPNLEGAAFPGEPLGCAMNVFRRSRIEAGQTVAVVGVGFLGALLVQLAAAAGARVLAVSRRAYARTVGEAAGAEAALPLAEPAELEARVLEWTGGEACDRVIEATGAQVGLDAASRLVRTRGRLVIAGFHQGGPRTVDLQSWNWRGIDVINAHEREPAEYVRGMRAAVAAVERGQLDPARLITHRFPLDRLGEALAMAAARPDGFLKAVVLTHEK